MRKFLFAAVLASLSTFSLLAPPQAEAALFSLSGNHRFGSNWFYNLDTVNGKNTNASDSTGYLEHRLIVRPDIIVDERFSIRTEFSLLSMNNFDTAVGTINHTNGGSTFDTHNGNDRSASRTQDFAVRAAYLKWNSDIGIFRAGRMPKGWGLGLFFNEGMNAEDESATIADRMSFEGQLGSLVLTAAFEKYEEGRLYQDIDDDEVFEGSVKYENESAGAQIGLLFGRHIRSADSTAKQAANGGLSSSNEFSFYGKKDWETLSLGAEVGSVAYDTGDDVYGGLAQMRWTPGAWNFEVDALYSSQSGGRAFIVNPNYRPLLILFRQSLGGNPGNTNDRFGPAIGFDPTGDNATTTPQTRAAESGVALGRVAIFYNFKQGKYKLGAVGGYAQLLKGNATRQAKELGIEADLIFEQKWYDNFKTSLTAGALFPGAAFPGSELVWGGQVRSYLNF